MQKKKQDIVQTSIRSRSRAHDIIQKMLANLGDPYTRFLTPSEVSTLQMALFFFWGMTNGSSAYWRKHHPITRVELYNLFFFKERKRGESMSLNNLHFPTCLAYL